MTKFISSIVIALVANILPFSLDSSEVILPSVVKIECSQSSGSAFFITPNILLSAGHMMLPESCGKEGVYIDGTSEKLEVLKVDHEWDLLLLRSERQGEPMPIRADNDLDYGDEVWIIGFPAPDTVLTVTKGVLSAFVPDLTATDATCFYGNSGGPAIDGNGYVIGVLVAGYWDARMCYFTSIENTKEFVRGYVG